MDREKVKEIKEELTYCYTGCDCYCPLYKNGKSYEECKNSLLFEALTLINELESEKEALWKGVKRLKKRYKETT